MRGGRPDAFDAALRRLDIQQCAFQVRHVRKVTIESDPFAAPFDCECGVPEIGHVGTAFAGRDAQVAKNLPMTFPRLDELAMRLSQKVVTKSKRIIER